LPKAITLDSASEITTLGIRLNESEDLSILERIWVAETLNDFVAGLDTSAPPLEDAQEDVFLVTQAEEPVHGELAWSPSVGTRGKILSLSRFAGLARWGHPWKFF
jgi:hypothetical protein